MAEKCEEFKFLLCFGAFNNKGVSLLDLWDLKLI